MTQYAWVLEVRPGYEEEYKKRHDEIWPRCSTLCRRPASATTRFSAMA